MASADQFHDFFGVGVNFRFCDIEFTFGEVIDLDPLGGGVPDQKSRIDRTPLGGPFFAPIEDAQPVTRSVASLLGVDLADFLGGIEIRWPSGGIPSATVTLEPTREEALAVLESKFLRPLTPFFVQFGYPERDILSPNMLFQIAGLPKLSLGPRITITIEAVNHVAFTARRRTSIQTVNRLRKEGRSPQQIAQSILQMPVDVSDLPDNHPFTRRQQNASTIPAHVGQDDLSYIHRLFDHFNIDYMIDRRSSGNGSEFAVICRQLTNPAPGSERDEEPVFDLVFYGQIDTQANPPKIPLLEFNTDAPLAFIGRNSVGIDVLKTDLDTGETARQRYDATGASDDSITQHPISQDTIKKLGANSLGGRKGLFVDTSFVCEDVQLPTLSPALNELDTGRVLRIPARYDQGLADAFVHHTKSEKVANIVADVRVPGIPEIRPFDLVRIQGVGSMFDGPYRVLEITHNLSGGFNTSMNLIRDSVWEKDPNENQQQNQQGPGAKSRKVEIAKIRKRRQERRRAAAQRRREAKLAPQIQRAIRPEDLF